MPRLSNSLAERWGSGTAAPFLWLVVFLLIGLPIGLVLVQAVVPGLFNLQGPDFTPSISALLDVATSPHLARGVVNTVLLGIAGAVIATLLGTALALLLSLSDVRTRRVWTAMPWLVFATPGYFKGLAWVLLMLPGGYLVQLGLLTPAAARSFFALPGLLMVMAFSLFPLPYFIVLARLQGLGGEYLDAARMASARPWRIVLRVVLPLLVPAIGLALLTAFAEIVGDFGIAATIARSMNFGLITYNIYAATASYPVDFPAAGAQALVLIVLIAGSIVAAGMSGSDKTTRFVSGRNQALVRFRLRGWQAPALGALALLGLGSVLLPLLAIAARAVTVSLGGGLAAGNLSLAALRAVFDPGSQSDQALIWSFAYSFAAAVIAVGLGLAFAYEISLAGRLTRLTTSGLALVTVALPGIVLAFGYILVYDRLPGFRDLPLYGSRLLVVIGYAAAALPYCLIFLSAALDRLGASLHEASRLAGASPRRHLTRIVLPMVGGALAIAFGVTMIRSLFELPMSQFLLPLAGPPLPVVIVNGFTEGRDAIACALALVALCLVGLVAGIAILAKRPIAAVLREV
jgi:iron(III) transport system permease protein